MPACSPKALVRKRCCKGKLAGLELGKEQFTWYEAHTVLSEHDLEL